MTVLGVGLRMGELLEGEGWIVGLELKSAVGR